MLRRSQHQNSNRADRIKALIKQSLAEIFLREEYTDSVNNRLSIMISDILIGPDLRIAQIFIRLFDKENINKEDLVNLLNKRSYIFFRILSKKLQLKYMPKLIFQYDDTMDHVNHINYLLQVSKMNQVKDELLDSN